MRKHFLSMGWKLPKDFNDEINPVIEPIYFCYVNLSKTKAKLFSRLQFSEIWTFVNIHFQEMLHYDKLLLTEFIIDIDFEWTNYLIDVENAKNRSNSRIKPNRPIGK